MKCDGTLLLFESITGRCENSDPMLLCEFFLICVVFGFPDTKEKLQYCLFFMMNIFSIVGGCIDKMMFFQYNVGQRGGIVFFAK